ncbi:Methionine ABC transporter substrate-binding protein [Cystobacter fuscus DSM 2262]|uniref:Lipoprotein n=1 Tax=Cystobacter fuscus (strain ATCC 25194 / DSM 2262 / NBRC 100088 / M29) TaxID=1242864 RepID=S9NU04_CYSF2|nr:MetQ/NlpA family ABC transporter substrate-binding protein [Cystobacter fuscus]EPX55615.1 Methionine ABC transporter substrate-binding protein [Cystobacter fuscus DSM 2262]
MKHLSKVLFTSSLLSVLAVAGCNKKSDAPAEQQQQPGAVRTLKVGVNPVPHGEILRVAAPLAERDGVRIEVIEFTDYVQPNIALADKQLDANYFQHVPYLERFSADRQLSLASVGAVHLEPLGVYSTKHTAIAALPEGAKVTIPADPTNGGRALRLLEQQGLLQLREGVGASGTLKDVVGNPKKLDLREIDAEQQPRTLQDVDAAIINGNYFLEAKKNLQLDAKTLAQESAQGNPYANILVVRKGDEGRPEIKTLLKALQSTEVRRYIESTYGGAVIPAF